MVPESHGEIRYMYNDMQDMTVRVKNISNEKKGLDNYK